MTEGNAHPSVPTTCEGVQHCGHDRMEDLSGELESRCGGCRVDDKDSGCESSVYQCEDSCYGYHEGHVIRGGSEHKTEPQSMLPVIPCVRGI